MATDPIFMRGREVVPASEVSVTGGSLVSILVPCCGMLDYKKLLVPSLLKHSRQPFEVIFIDIGSLDGTAEYLAGVAATAAVRMEVVRAATDLLIQDACKEALARARGDYVVLLNNDTVVTSAWLNQLIGLITMSPAIGAVGPMSNYAAPPQLVEPVPYRTLRPTKPKGAASPTARNGAARQILDMNAVH
jgi:cellulose synthase/poly-beta-1,6-N-acetylglucosamine synthase-like glycosyltransferase